MFWRSRVEDRLERMSQLLQRSFSNVKNDTNSLFQWVQYLNRKNQEQETMIRMLSNELSAMPKSPEQIKKIIDSYYSYEGLLSQIQRLNSRVDELLQRQQYPHQGMPQQEIIAEKQEVKEISELKDRLEKLETKKLSLKERLIKRLTKNSKDYVKSAIISYIKRYESIPALQLKEMVVDDQALCSKSSFYRILEEIEEMSEIGTIKKGKEKHYFYKAIKNI